MQNGKCVRTEFVKSHKRIRPHGGEEEEVEALCNGNKTGEDFQRHKKALALPSKTDVAEDCNSQRVKIVVTRKQLELLIKSGVELHLRRISNQSRVRRTCKRWRPCLATIPEL